MKPLEVIEYLESHPLDGAFVKILQRDYEFELYQEEIRSFLFYHYGQLPNRQWRKNMVEYASPDKYYPFGRDSVVWVTGSLPEFFIADNILTPPPPGLLNTSRVFEYRSRGHLAKIQTYQDPDGERGLRFKYYWITLIGEDYDDFQNTENPLEDYYSDPDVREEYSYGVDECLGEYEIAEFDLPYRLRSSVLNYPQGFR